ncbi:capsular biosynthesis protein [Tardiphaga sp. 862_B3_N1_1]|uniref:capsular biosynthesis protein n=1 Tax=Tardiphaga sp. 862_B3_N1_1 TaxID=3240763 RepID=UPI003F8B6526
MFATIIGKTIFPLREVTTSCGKSISLWLKRQRWFRICYFTFTRWHSRFACLPNWPKLLAQDFPAHVRAVNANSTSGQRILIATGTAGHLPSMTVESFLGVALTHRGASVSFLLCDRILPACMMCEISWHADLADFGANGPRDRCSSCYKPASAMLADAQLAQIGLSSRLSDLDRTTAQEIARSVPFNDIAGYTVDGVAVGEHALAGTLRFFARGDLTHQSHAETVARRYFEAALLTYFACRALFGEDSFDVVVLNHGIYVPQGLVAEAARKFGVRIITWHPAYRRGCFIFNHDETYHHGLLNEPVEQWENITWHAGHRSQIETYLRSRWVGKQDWVKFHHDPELDIDAISRETGVDFSRPTIGLLTNVVWDAQLHYRANAFPGMIDWLLKTIAYFATRPQLQLLIRIHPAELTGNVPSRQLAIDEVSRAFPSLPANVFIIPPTSRASTYAAMEKCDAVLIYGTKTGVELTSSGIPVIVAGEAWIRGKGVTLDASSEAEYVQLLDRLPLSNRLDSATRDRALKYAFHFFYRRMVPIDAIKEASGWPPFAVSIAGLSDLDRGKSPGLDVVCDGILSNTPFIYHAEDDVSLPAGQSVSHAH